ncbi:MFS transporter [Phaeovibrio sulfidiphilus]|uniref:MFS transporter n=1 Tax=Phaeovibrio sulfidiphilus TaxID=1220600 RepID=A0A8J7CNW1_9PROT|nr:MFS transporter [Phaeovibrio sulfidiphilus]MBE1236362.1 MFS transporter [Phaeovibrio sulfidiphilus]
MRHDTVPQTGQAQGTPTASLARLVPAIGSIYIAQTLVSMIAMQSVPALLRDAGVPLEMIGFSALFMAPWVLKVLWAPRIERWRLPPHRTRRFSKRIILSGQALLALVFAGTGLMVGNATLETLAVGPLFAALVLAAFLAASVDIACDGMAVDHLDARSRQWGNLAQVGGGYVGFLLGTSVFLIVCAHFGPGTALVCSACFIAALGLPLLGFSESPREPGSAAHHPGLRHALSRREIRQGLLALVLLEAGLRTATGLIGPLLVDRGADLEFIGWLFGGFTVGCGLAGAVLGAVLVRHLGAWRAVVLAYGFQAVILASLALALDAPLGLLATLIGLKFSLMAAGLVSLYSALMGLTSPRQAGVDFTVFQSADALVALLGGLLGGWLAGRWGYGASFVTAAGCAAVATLIVACRTPGTDTPSATTEPGSGLSADTSGAPS